ncbi:hypothetical protein MMPV_004198 [Pyropia vietnamensis]
MALPGHPHRRRQPMVTLAARGGRLLPRLPAAAGAYAAASLRAAGVDVRLGEGASLVSRGKRGGAAALVYRLGREVWVDAAAGTLGGGDDSGGRGPSAPPRRGANDLGANGGDGGDGGDVVLVCTGGVPNTAWAAAVLGGGGTALRVHPDLRVVGADRIYAAGDVVGEIADGVGGGGGAAADRATAPTYERTAYAAVAAGTLAARNILVAAAAAATSTTSLGTPTSPLSSFGTCRRPTGSGTYPDDAFPLGRFPLVSIVSTGPRDAVAVAGRVVVATGWVSAAAKAVIRWLAVGGVAEQPRTPPPWPTVGEGRGSGGGGGRSRWHWHCRWRWRWRWRLFLAAETVSTAAVNVAAAVAAAAAALGRRGRTVPDER